jgi:hypothetical protein
MGELYKFGYATFKVEIHSTRTFFVNTWSGKYNYHKKEEEVVNTIKLNLYIGTYNYKVLNENVRYNNIKVFYVYQSLS